MAGFRRGSFAVPHYLTFSNAHPCDVTFATNAITKGSAAKSVSDPDRTTRTGKTVRFLLSCFGKRTKDTQLAMKKASGAFTNSETRSGHLFSIGCAEDKLIDGKTVGKLYKYPDGNNAVCPTKCGNYERPANGSQRAYKSGVRSCTGT
jgi:hypothetical protein